MGNKIGILCLHFHSSIVQRKQQKRAKKIEKMTNLSTFLSRNTTKPFSSFPSCRKLMLIVGTSAAANAKICCTSAAANAKICCTSAATKQRICCTLAAANATNFLHFGCSELCSEFATVWLQWIVQQLCCTTVAENSLQYGCNSPTNFLHFSFKFTALCQRLWAELIGDNF